MHRPYNPLSLPFTQHSPNCRFLIIVIFMNRIWVWISIGKSLVCGENRSFAIESRLHWRIYIVAIICMFVLFCCYCCFVVLLHSHSLYSSIVPSTTIIPPPSISSLFISPYCVCVCVCLCMFLLRCVATSPTSFATSFSARDCDCDNCRPIFSIGLKKGIYSVFSRNHRTHHRNGYTIAYLRNAMGTIF